MIVGRMYRLNAQWHPRHGRVVFVVHSREGLSDEYRGRTIYHIVDSDDFSTEPDWDSEYPQECFTEIVFDYDLPKYMKLVDKTRNINRIFTHTIPGFPNNNVKWMLAAYCPSQIREVLDYMLLDLPKSLSMQSVYDEILFDSGWMSGDQLLNMREYFDDDYNFIKQCPPN